LLLFFPFHSFPFSPLSSFPVFLPFLCLPVSFSFPSSFSRSLSLSLSFSQSTSSHLRLLFRLPFWPVSAQLSASLIRCLILTWLQQGKVTILPRSLPGTCGAVTSHQTS
jgi:hypothetical protein